MRISDWSSDVCSSDLEIQRALPGTGTDERHLLGEQRRLHCGAPHAGRHQDAKPAAFLLRVDFVGKARTRVRVVARFTGYAHEVQTRHRALDRKRAEEG